jgi:hypothetical protein
MVAQRAQEPVPLPWWRGLPRPGEPAGKPAGEPSARLHAVPHAEPHAVPHAAPPVAPPAEPHARTIVRVGDAVIFPDVDGDVPLGPQEHAEELLSYLRPTRISPVSGSAYAPWRASIPPPLRHANGHPCPGQRYRGR